MKHKEYRRIMTITLLAIVAIVAYGVIQNSLFIAFLAITLGIVFLFLLRRSLTEIEHDERTVIIQNKAASVTIAIVTVAMTVIGLSLVFLNWGGTEGYEETGYLLAFLACFILILNTVLSYYYRKKLGG